MRNKFSNLYGFMALLLCLPYACSYEDKTTYAGDPLPDIIIDTTNIPVNLLITREDTLIVKPKVSKAGVSKDQLEFEWCITLNRHGGATEILCRRSSRRFILRFVV